MIGRYLRGPFLRGPFLRGTLAALPVVALLLLAAVLFPRTLRARPARVPVIDLHVDLAYRSLYKHRPFAEGSGEFRASQLQSGGLAGVVLPLFVPADYQPGGRSLTQFERSYAWVFEQIVATPPYSLPGCGIGRAGDEARPVATWLAFEGSGPLPVDEQELRGWILRGLRVFGLVHSRHNTLATSSGEPANGRGLSDRGKRFVSEVFKLGAVVDVSHSSDESVADVLRLAEERGGVAIATHSNARRLAPHPRNLTDAQIRGIARTGGVVGVNFHQTFLEPASRRAALSDVVEQVLYIASVGGDAVVAIGSDFEGGIRPAEGLSSALTYQALADALRQAGVSEAKLQAYLSGNALRVLCPRNRANASSVVPLQ